MIKTINLTGSEMRVTELGGDNTEIFNNSNGIVYASKLPNITIGGDEVIAIPAGAIDGLYGTRGTVYLLGLGSVELRGVDHKITKSRGQSAASAGGAGVPSSYVDEKCNEILDNANAYADIRDSEVLVSVKEYADSLNAELAGYIGYTDNDIYGLEADFENCVFTRLAGAVGKTAGADFDCVNAYGGRRRCNLSDSGEVLAYYGDENFKADGSNGQVMVEQPKFYYRVVPLKTEKIEGVDGHHLRKARYYISDTPKAGFKVHPAFVRDGVEVDKIFLSAFEGSIYDVSSGIYLLNDEQIANFNDDKLSSIAGAIPCSGSTQKLTRENSRKLAQNRGSGWEITYAATASASQLLMLIEFASFDIQSAMGNGNVYNINGVQSTGVTCSLGDKSGTILNSNEVQIPSYRGEENLWGNIWVHVDGINTKNPQDTTASKYGKLYVADHDFVDDTSTGAYSDTGIYVCCGKGYVSAFGYSRKYDWLFIASELIGDNALPVGDYMWNTYANWKVALLGGHFKDSDRGGAFAYSMDSRTSNAISIFGCRTVFIPLKTQNNTA